MKALSIVLGALSLPLMGVCTGPCACPLLDDWSVTEGIPPFESIRPADFLPAFRAAIATERSRIAAIVSNGEAPDYENTVRAFTLSEIEVNRIDSLLCFLVSADTSSELEAVKRERTPLLTARNAANYSNAALFARIEKVWARREQLTEEQRRVTERLRRMFIRAGVSLPHAQQLRLKEIEERLSLLSQRFIANLNLENNAFKSKFGFGVGVFTERLAATDDRALRESYYRAFHDRCRNGGETDNREIVRETLRLRLEKAKMLGFATTAEMVLEDKLAKATERVMQFIAELQRQCNVALSRQQHEFERMMEADVAACRLGADSRLACWDWPYYASMLRKRECAFDSEATRRYFRLDKVVKGAMLAAKRLYGLEFVEIPNAPTYRPGATRAFRVMDADGSHVGIFIHDYRTRPSKSDGGFMMALQPQYLAADGKDVRPVIVNVCNFGDYLNVEEVQTLFHEFGHALHGLLSRCENVTVSGVCGESAYCEIFSQFNENFAFLPEMLREYATDDRGEVVPPELIARRQAAANFDAAFEITVRNATSQIDMMLHLLKDVENVDFGNFDRPAMDRIEIPQALYARHETPYLRHSFVHGYEAGYYSYAWSECLAANLYAVFSRSGESMNPELAKKFRKTFLERGYSLDPMTSIREFIGGEPSFKVYLEKYGL